jgi:hypothetical protein
MRKTESSVAELENGRGSQIKECGQFVESGIDQANGLFSPKVCRKNTILLIPWY